MKLFDDLDEIEDNESDDDSAGFELEPDDEEPEEKREAAQQQRLTLWRTWRQKLAAADPASAPQDLYNGYLWAIRQHEHCDTINTFLVDLDARVRSHLEPEQLAAYARLIDDGIIEPESQDAFNFRIHRENFPAETRDLYAVVLDYLAHKCAQETLDSHTLKYKVDIYHDEDCKAVVARLQAAGYLDSKLKILKRPEGATAWEEHIKFKGGEGEVSVTRGEYGGFVARFGCSVTTKVGEGHGIWSPVRPEGFSWDDDASQEWKDAEEARKAAIWSVAKQAEEIIQHAPFRDWKPSVVEAARKLRAWAELINGGLIPAILAPTWGAEHEAALRGIHRKYEESEAEIEAEESELEEQKPGEQFALFG